MGYNLVHLDSHGSKLFYLEEKALGVIKMLKLMGLKRTFQSEESHLKYISTFLNKSVKACETSLAS